MGLWLKKYTKIKYLDSILTNKTLFLGDPASWEDKNDVACIEMYNHAMGAKTARVTCLTGAPDRFHFWHVFGKCAEGVCLWFDKNSLIEDIGRDESLICGDVEYKSIDCLKGKVLDVSKVPFLKRKQYKDENEFRVIRGITDKGSETDTFSFSPKSLRRIYLNPWMPSSTVIEKQAEIKRSLSKDLGHVKIRQSRAIKYQKWIEAVKRAALCE